MLNTKELRREYRKVRREMTANEHIGDIVLIVIIGVFSTTLIAVMVRVICISLVWVKHLIN